MRRTLSLCLLCVSMASTPMSVFAMEVYFDLAADGAINASMDDTNRWRDVAVMEPTSLAGPALPSAGSGWGGSATLGFQFVEHCAFEIGVGFRRGLRSTYSNDNPADGVFQELSLSADVLRFTPALVFSSKVARWRPYARVGPMLAFAYMDWREDKQLRFAGGAQYKTTTEVDLNGPLLLGLHGAVGTTMRVDESLSFFVEVAYTGVAAAVAKAKITRYEVDGQDKLGTLARNEKDFVFVDQPSASKTYSNDSPREVVSKRFRLSSIGMRVGLRVDL